MSNELRTENVMRIARTRVHIDRLIKGFCTIDVDIAAIAENVNDPMLKAHFQDLIDRLADYASDLYRVEVANRVRVLTVASDLLDCFRGRTTFQIIDTLQGENNGYLRRVYEHGATIGYDITILPDRVNWKCMIRQSNVDGMITVTTMRGKHVTAHTASDPIDTVINRELHIIASEINRLVDIANRLERDLDDYANHYAKNEEKINGRIQRANAQLSSVTDGDFDAD